MKHLRMAALAASLSLVASTAAAQGAPLLTVTIKPGPMSEAAGKGDIEVDLKVQAMDVPAGQPLFALPAMAPNMPSPQPVTDIVVRDAQGVVPLAARDAGGGKPWTATRRVSGDVSASYRLPVDNARGSGPPINLRIDGEAFSSPGRMLVATPQTKTDYRIAIRWDLSAMAPGSVGVSAYGDGDVDLPPGPAARLTTSLFMAGRLTREPATPGGAFSASWAGEPPFDPRPLMQWTGRLHAWMSGFFRDTSEPAYRVFLRRNTVNPGGGVAMTQSFAVGYDTGTDPEGLKSILGHEMTHTWTANEDLGKWYSEGNAVYYQGLLPWRAGLITTDQFLADINETAARYYGNPLKATPEAEVLPRFWEDTRVRVLPYDRGALYFAVLNGKILTASGGRRSIDDLILTMIDEGRDGTPATLETWLGLLRRELGDAGPAIHASMLAGGVMIPDSGAFGPCFRRTTRKIREFEPGFDLASISGPQKVIRGLKPQSEAAKAGLREGDRVLKSTVGGDAAQSDLARMATLTVEREGKPVAIRYLPRGATIEAYQWERAPDAPRDGGCR